MLQQLTDIMGEVRGDGYYYSLKDFITPEEPIIQEIASILAKSEDPIATAQDFVHRVVRYRRQNGEYWRYPTETLEVKQGDCDESSILLCTILRNYLPAEEIYVAVGDMNGSGHAWVVRYDLEETIIESTASSKNKVNKDKYKPEVIFNDRYAFAKPNEFGFLLVGQHHFEAR